MRRKVRIFRRSIPLWLIGLLLIACGAGAAVGTILVGKVTGDIPVTVSQALLVGEPSFPDGLPCGVTRQTIRIMPRAPDRAIGIVGDDAASFRAAAEVDTGDVYLIKLPLKNASNQDLIAELTLNVPQGLEVEVFGSDEETCSLPDNIRHVTRIGPNTWTFRVSYLAEMYDADWRDSIGIVVGADDDIMPGFYTIEATLRQVPGAHVNKPLFTISKVGPAEVALNGRADYTIKVVNRGDAPATQLIVEDGFPAGMTYLSSNPPATVAGNVAAWNAGTLGAGESRTFLLSLTAAQAGEWTNTVLAYSGEGTKAEAQAVTKVVVPAIAITKTGPTQSGLGANVSYLLTVRNTGAVNLTNLLITDQMPNGMSYVSSNPSGVIAGKQASWAFASLSPGQYREISLVLRGDTVGSWTNTVTVTTSEGVSSSAAATTAVAAQAGGMTMSSTDTVDPINVNEQTTYVVTITNQGMLPLHNVRVTDIVPDRMNFVSATGPATYTVSGRTVTFNAAPVIAPGETLTYRIIVLAVTSGAAVNLATMTYDEFGSPVTVQEPTTIYASP